MTASLRISDGKGFGITFKNGITVSVQTGKGNYCDNYNFPHFEITRENPLPASTTAEIAMWDSNGSWPDIDGNQIKGYVPIEDVFRFLEFARSLPNDLVRTEIEIAMKAFDWSAE